MNKEFTCQQCKIKFIRTDNHPYKFCSTKCARNGQIDIVRKPPKEFVCKYCHNIFYRQVSQNDKHPNREFCSSTCRNKARAIEQIPCPVCGEYFSPIKNKGAGKPAKTFCSRPCASQGTIRVNFYRRPTGIYKSYTPEEEQFIRDNYSFNGADWIASQLDWSKKRVVNLVGRWHLRLNIETNYKLVHAAAAKYMTQNNPMHNSETAQKVGKAYSKRYSEDSSLRERILSAKAAANRRNGTKPELRCKQILENLGVSFEYQFLIKPKFIVDFCIDKIIIQVDGEYWHGHPRFEPLTPRQIAQKKRDLAQDKYLATCGYKVFRVWENELSEEKIRLFLSPQLG